MKRSRKKSIVVKTIAETFLENYIDLLSFGPVDIVSMINENGGRYYNMTTSHRGWFSDGSVGVIRNDDIYFFKKSSEAPEPYRPVSLELSQLP